VICREDKKEKEGGWKARRGENEKEVYGRKRRRRERRKIEDNDRAGRNGRDGRSRRVGGLLGGKEGERGAGK